MLVELSVMEQQYQAELAGVVQDGRKVVEVARRLGVSRQALRRHGVPMRS